MTTPVGSIMDEPKEQVCKDVPEDIATIKDEGDCIDNGKWDWNALYIPLHFGNFESDDTNAASKRNKNSNNSNNKNSSNNNRRNVENVTKHTIEV